MAARRDVRRVVRTLAVTETLIWASIFYVFPAMLPRWEADLGWSKTEIAGALTASLVVAALAAPWIGALIDRGHGRAVMTAGPLLGALSLALLAGVETRAQFYLAWVALGVAQAASLYEPCFALLTRLFRDGARRAITLVTLAAGFAGTVAFPAAHLLSEAMGWRAALLLFAAVVAAAAIANARALRGVEAAPDDGEPASKGRSALRGALRRPVFWLLAGAFALLALNHGALLAHLLPLLDERGVSPGAAVFAAAMIGPMQVAGRLGMMAAERYASLTAITAVCFVLMGAATAALYLAGARPAFLALFVLFQGAGFGVNSIVRPSITAAFLGRDSFGAISGALAVGFMGAFAVAPTLAALTWSLGGYDLVIAAAFASVALGLACFAAAARLSRRPDM
jgi:predicted MFS family arabinose efflux permease